MRQVSHLRFLPVGYFLISSLAPTLLHAQATSEALQSALAAVSPRDRILEPVADNDRLSLDGNTLPQALPAYETGVPDGGQRLEHMLLTLKPDPEQQAALDALVAAQNNPSSPLYHQWLTPETYAEHFGASTGDIGQIQGWLERNGFMVEEVAASHRSITFSGSVSQVENAFQTRMRSYRFAKASHIANESDPQIPVALAPVVGGVVSLHDVFSAPQHHSIKLSPEFTSGSAHYLTPFDYGAIYDINSLYNQAYNGSGETIAIVGRSQISLPDVRSFRSQFGLPAKDPVVIVNGAAPSSGGSDMEESMLDVEWSGAVARGATIDYVTSASTAVSDGVFLSSQYVVNNNLAPLMSVSYGLCESSLGASANAFFNALWEQAASQGITVLVSAGDSGAAGCDSSSATKATQGKGVNGICSSPYSTCVGGSQFNEGTNAGQYWGSSNSSAGLSALGYIPEVTWNESGSSGLWSTGGGVSTVYAKPSWQAGIGVPNDGKRDVPDVALTAAGHDAYLVQVSGALYAFSGTSAASPSFAGLLALVAQKADSRLGNANPELYKLAAAPGSGVFHDIVSGNNSVPGVTGFVAAAGYDQTTGLGSVDAEKLLTAWTSAGSPSTPSATFSLKLSAASLKLAAAGGSTTVTTAVSGGFKSPLSLSVSGLPAGLTATFSPASIASPGAGTSTLKLTAAATLAPGSWTLTITATGGGVTQTASLPVSLPGVGMALTPAAKSLVRGSTMKVTLATTAAGGFNSALTFAVSGLPAGVSAAFSPATVAAPGSGSVTLTLTATRTAALGAAKVQITAKGGTFIGVASLPLTVVATGASGVAHRL